MRNLYARFILWLIRPAVERVADERIAVAVRSGGVIWKTRATVNGPIYQGGLGAEMTAKLRQVVQAEIERRPPSPSAG